MKYRDRETGEVVEVEEFRWRTKTKFRFKRAGERQKVWSYRTFRARFEPVEDDG